MKLTSILALAGLLLALTPAVAAEAKGDPKADLQALVQEIRNGLAAGKRSPEALAPEIRKFDALIKKYQGQKTDDVASILMMKAMLYAQVFSDLDTAMPILEQVKKDFPNTRPGQQVDQVIEALERQREQLKIQASLSEGKVFPDFQAKDLNGKPLSVGKYKGKVVLVDFWATWCGPCVGEMPNVIKAYQKYNPQGFEIIGISLDSDRDKLVNFIKKNNMPWAQYFDGKGWRNELAQKYGVNSIPATYLIGPDGKILGKNLRGHALEAAVGAALAKK